MRFALGIAMCISFFFMRKHLPSKKWSPHNIPLFPHLIALMKFRDLRSLSSSYQNTWPHLKWSITPAQSSSGDQINRRINVQFCGDHVRNVEQLLWNYLNHLMLPVLEIGNYLLLLNYYYHHFAQNMRYSNLVKCWQHAIPRINSENWSNRKFYHKHYGEWLRCV